MDLIYQRAETTIDVTNQSELNRWIKTHRVFDGRNPDGSTRFRLMEMDFRGNQPQLADEIHRPSRVLDTIKSSNLQELKDIEKREIDTIKFTQKRADLRGELSGRVGDLRLIVRTNVLEAGSFDEINEAIKTVPSEFRTKGLRSSARTRFNFLKRTGVIEEDVEFPKRF